MDSATKELLTRYQEQNKEIVKHNTRLNERINVLEGIIHELQQDILKFRIEKAMAKKKKVAIQKSKPAIKKKETVLKPKDCDSQELVIYTKRNTKSINYVLPSTKSKLRKGDPFTFGNE